MLLQQFQNKSQMLNMFRFSLAVNEYVIKKHQYKLYQIFLQQLILSV
jgi:hypothetical protein